MKDAALSRLIRKLHAAELAHLRELVAEHQAQIEAQAARIEQLEREARWADDRADMFADIANELRADMPTTRVGITPAGRVGLLN